jgi:hypothetical protein
MSELSEAIKAARKARLRVSSRLKARIAELIYTAALEELERWAEKLEGPLDAAI